MDAARFDRFACILATAASRRHTVMSLLAGAAALTIEVEDSAAGPGCKDVGKKCRNKGQCCSGVCRGGKTKRCKAHDTGGCKSGQPLTECGGSGGPAVSCTSSAGQGGRCDTTTGNAGFCTFDQGCFPCAKDADCRPYCGPNAACVRCSVACADEGGTACGGPSGCTFPP